MRMDETFLLRVLKIVARYARICEQSHWRNNCSRIVEKKYPGMSVQAGRACEKKEEVEAPDKSKVNFGARSSSFVLPSSTTTIPV